MKAALPILLLLAASAVFAQDELQISGARQGTQELPHLATSPAGDFVVAWVGTRPDAPASALYARRFAAGGSPASAEILVSDEVFPSFQSSAVALMADGSFVAAFSKGAPASAGSALEARWIAPDGSLRDGAVVSRDAVTDVVIAARPDGGVVLAWQSGDRPSVRARAFGPDRKPLGPEVLVGRMGSAPAVAVAPDGGFFVAWNDRSRVAVRRFAADGSPLGAIQEINPKSENPVFNVRVGTDAEGNARVLWWGDSAPAGKSAFVRRVGADGQPRGEAVPLTLAETGPPLSLAVGPDGGFVVAWNVSTADRSDIFARRFSADGSPAGPVARVNAEGPGTRGLAQAGILADGGFLVVWQSDERAERANEIFARRFEER